MMKPKPLDLSHHFSRMANRRTASSVSDLTAALSTSTFNAGPGFPFAGNYPVDTLEGAIATRNRFPLHPFAPISLPDPNAVERFTVPKVSLDTNPSSEIDLKVALQYQSSSGLPPLAGFVQDWAVNYQNQGRIPYENPQTLLTGGAMDGFAKCMATFANEGDAILMDANVYFTARDMVLPFGVRVVPVELDEHGLSPGSLEKALEGREKGAEGKKPHLMYTVSLGQNPTGIITPLWRKKQIYAICHKHDILIFEDDPYWALQYDIPGHKGSDPATYDLLAALAPSYLAIDIDGRVISLQTFTKIFAPGCRMGWMVAQPAFIVKLTQTTDGTTSNPSGFAEAAVAQVLIREWNGPKGLVRWIGGLRAHYRTRRDVFCEVLAEGRDIILADGDKDNAAASDKEDEEEEGEGTPRTRKRKQHLRHSYRRHRTRVYDFEVPAGGMYVWVNLHMEAHPLASAPYHLSPKEIVLRLWEYLVDKHSLVTIPGYMFNATPEVKLADNYVRLTFVATSLEQLQVAARLFVVGVREFWQVEEWEVSSTNPRTVGVL